MDERHWVDDYHRAVRAKIGPLLEGADLAWLDRATAAL
jgi:Xaa-Pro aminopeptidase